MSKFFTLVAIGLTLSFGAAHAQAQKQAPQQDKTTACDKAAGNKKGDERTAFIRICMTASSQPQQDKMATCGHASRAEDL